MTVSRALRNAPNVSPGTTDRILRVAEQLGFIPAVRRQAPAQARHFYILCQQEYSENDAFFREIITSIQDQLFASGFACSLGIVKPEYPASLKLTNLLRSTDLDGVLVVGEIPAGFLRSLQAQFTKLIFVDYPGDSSLGLPYNAVCTDCVNGARLAVKHLLKLGRSRILLIAGRKGHYFTNQLLQGYTEVLLEHGVKVDPLLITYADFHLNGGMQAARRVLESGISIDAVFSNDEMACGAMKAIKESGLRIPEDIAVVGFDGLPIGELVSPALTTIEVDRRKMGRVAVKRLLAIQQEDPDDELYEKILLFPRLVVRESCGGVAKKPVIPVSYGSGQT
jgi:LacI family transcriptional regulator, repressor for deo operon, udp, cdd, tsx, nupC, and nupG